jgi:hypothetical protein
MYHSMMQLKSYLKTMNKDTVSNESKYILDELPIEDIVEIITILDLS